MHVQIQIWNSGSRFIMDWHVQLIWPSSQLVHLLVPNSMQCGDIDLCMVQPVNFWSEANEH